MTTTKTKTIETAVINAEIDFSSSYEYQLPPGFELEELASSEYDNPNPEFPRIQTLRGNTPEKPRSDFERIPDNYMGFYVSHKELTKADWINLNQELIEYPFETGVKEYGLLFKEPWMLVCPASSLFLMQRQTEKGKTPEVRSYSDFEPGTVDKSIYVNCQYFFIILLGKDKKPLHNIPFLYLAKGATQATFAIEWNKFCKDMENIYASLMAKTGVKINTTKKNNEFYRLLIFKPTLAREMAENKETKKKSVTLKVVGYEKPTPDNWLNFMLEKPIRDRVNKLFLPVQGFKANRLEGASTNVAALPAATNTHDVEVVNSNDPPF